MTIKILTAVLASALLARAAAAEDAPAKKWKNQAELGFVSASGNTKTTTFSFNDLFGYVFDANTSAQVKAGMLSARSNDATTAEQYSASEKVDWKFQGGNYLFEQIAWDKDRFAGISGRWNGSVGYGRSLIDTPADKLNGELGGGYVQESRIPSATNNFASGRAYAKYTRVLSPTASASQDAEYLYDFKNSQDYRFNAETALISSISTMVSLKLGFKYRHTNLPPAGFKKDDTITSAALIFNF